MEDEKKVDEQVSEAEIVEEKKEEVIVEETIKTEEEIENEKDKKIKNLISLAILLGGLFVGSLFIDIVQLVKGGGFSDRALQSADVFAAGGKTWVAYAEPIVKVQVINDDTCDNCKPDEALVGLRRVMPTMLTEKIDVNSAQGKDLVSKLGIKTLPAFVFSKELENVDLFKQAQTLFDKKNDVYVLKTAEVGLPIGKYVATPQISDSDITIGSKDAAIKVVAYSNFQSPADRQAFQTIITPMLKDYGDKIQLAFKNYLPPTATQAMSAALASACANEQGKFLTYADKLFVNQDAWGKAKDATPMLKGYAATLGLNTADFGKCLDSKKYQDLLTQTLADGQSFGITATPSIFVGDQLETGTLTYDAIKKVLDAQLQK